MFSTFGFPLFSVTAATSKKQRTNGINETTFDVPFLDDDDSVDDKEKPTKKIKLATVLRVGTLVLLAVSVTTFLGLFIGSNQVQDKTVDVINYLSSLPTAVSSIIMILMYSVALVLFCPGTPFNLAAGFMFGIWLGFLTALGGCLLGATLAFLFGRTIARLHKKQNRKISKVHRG